MSKFFITDEGFMVAMALYPLIWKLVINPFLLLCPC
jgi:hypothetical protein